MLYYAAMGFYTGTIRIMKHGYIYIAVLKVVSGFDIGSIHCLGVV